MRIPRWLVVTLLITSALALLGAGAWWWVTWPYRTIHKFAELVEMGDLDSANTMIVDSDGSWQDARLEFDDESDIWVRCVWGGEGWDTRELLDALRNRIAHKRSAGYILQSRLDCYYDRYRVLSVHQDTVSFRYSNAMRR
jgi:hypothetical protein